MEADDEPLVGTCAKPAGSVGPGPRTIKMQDEMRSTVHSPRVTLYTFVMTLAICIGMIGFEVTKECFAPAGMTRWESHIITIMFATVLGGLLGWVGLRRGQKQNAALAQALAKQGMARQAALREAAKLSAMISGMEEGVVFANADNVIVEINSYLCRFIGKSREEIVGKRMEDLHHGMVLDKLLGHIRDFRENVNSDAYVLQRPLGSTEVIMRMQPIYRDGRYDGVLLNVIDVTALVRTRRRNELILNSALDGFYTLDLDVASSA